MAPKKKLGQILIKLVSQAQTGFFYVVRCRSSKSVEGRKAPPAVAARRSPRDARTLPLPSNPSNKQTKKNPRNVPYKLQRVKYDPVVNKHVLFSEAKLK
jgi:ribosomal protein L33